MTGLDTSTLVFDPIVSIPFVVVLGIVLVALTGRVYWVVGKMAGTWRNALLFAFRLAALILVLTLLLRPSRRESVPPPKRDLLRAVALDTSLSMKQRDAAGAARIDAARSILQTAGIITALGEPSDPGLRLFEFSDDARPVAKSLLAPAAKGKTTHFHKSIGTILSASAGGEAIDNLILLTDGHDFEMVNPAKTGMSARNDGAALYAVAVGKQGGVRDVSVRITGYQPYCYVKQKARVDATLRLIGCELEDITVQLLREGHLVQTKRFNAQQLQELPVEFEVTEPQTGQYEYEVHAIPLENEVSTANNSALTYLNVIDQQIRILLLEGDPYWDTSFLQRSLMRNDKFEVDALVGFGSGKIRAIRKTSGLGELKVPRTPAELSAYDVVILGRAVDTLVASGNSSGSTAADWPALLDAFVNERGGALVFSRGQAFANPTSSGLEPVRWGNKTRDHVHLDVTAEGRSVSPLRTLGLDPGAEALPELVNSHAAESVEPLTSTFAVAARRDEANPTAAIAHRRYGRGQVVTVGVEGLWRWSLNAKLEGPNLPFDRFWDQMIVWLMAGRDFIPNKQFSFRPNSVNVLLGEKAYFRVTSRQSDPRLKSVPATIYFGDAEVGRITLSPALGSVTRLSGEFLPERAGRYRAAAKLPDGTTQESRFIVYSENLEETEVATDTLYLRRLCEASGGRLLDASELGKLWKELNRKGTEDTPKTVLRPIWNEAWVFYLAGLLLGVDWFLRRRWGLC